MNKRSLWKKTLAVTMAAGVSVLSITGCGQQQVEEEVQVASAINVNAQKPQVGDIALEREFIGTISAENTVSVVNKASGKVLDVRVSVGDKVEEDDILFTVDTESLDSTLSNVNKAIDRTQRAYNTALENYQDLLDEQEKLTIKSDSQGYVKSLDVEVGDEVTGGTQLAYLCDNYYMELKVPFLSNEVDMAWIGTQAYVELTMSGEITYGTVKEIAATDDYYNGMQIVRYVTIVVENPGGLQEGISAIAQVNGIESIVSGNFTLGDTEIVLPDYPGKIEEIFIKEGDWVEKDQVLMRMSSETLDNQIKSLKNALDSASDSVTDAIDNRADTLDALEDYTVTAPVSGTIESLQVTKDNMASAGTVVAVISDNNHMNVVFQVSEEIRQTLSIGQEAEIEKDGVIYKGAISEIGTSATSTGLFSVKVSVEDETGGLLSGTTVKVRIQTYSSSNTLLLPYDSVYFRNGQAYLYIEKNGYAVKKDVVTGLQRDDKIEIKEGITKNDNVITTWSANLGDNVEVNVIESKEGTR